GPRGSCGRISKGTATKVVVARGCFPLDELAIRQPECGGMLAMVVNNWGRKETAVQRMHCLRLISECAWLLAPRRPRHREVTCLVVERNTAVLLARLFELNASRRQAAATRNRMQPHSAHRSLD